MMKEKASQLGDILNRYIDQLVREPSQLRRMGLAQMIKDEAAKAWVPIPSIR